MRWCLVAWGEGKMPDLDLDTNWADTEVCY